MTTLLLNTLTARQNPAFVSRFMEALRENTKRRLARKAFLSMDDHMLSDIGITRGQVTRNSF